MTFGTHLLDDGDGTIMSDLDHQHQKTSHAILNDVFTKWIQGEGTTCSWDRLLTCLKICKCRALADDIEKMLS